MPGISDPGVSLIQAAVAAGHQVDVLPGASAVTTAVAAAALPAEGFIFVGFLPRRSSAASAVLQRASSLPYALVLFESPRRVAATLSLAMSLLGDRQSVALKEMSKLHQEVMRGSLSELVQALSAGEPRGEWTLVIGPGSDSTEDIDDTAVLEVVRQLIEGGASPRDAARQAAERLEVTRTRAYNLWTKKSRV
jgi:16S rRNA (cytidine1402-2'-O)-methyltransferase